MKTGTTIVAMVTGTACLLMLFSVCPDDFHKRGARSRAIDFFEHQTINAVFVKNKIKVPQNRCDLSKSEEDSAPNFIFGAFEKMARKIASLDEKIAIF